MMRWCDPDWSSFVINLLVKYCYVTSRVWSDATVVSSQVSILSFNLARQIIQVWMIRSSMVLLLMIKTPRSNTHEHQSILCLLNFKKNFNWFWLCFDYTWFIYSTCNHDKLQLLPTSIAAAIGYIVATKRHNTSAKTPFGAY